MFQDSEVALLLEVEKRFPRKFHSDTAYIPCTLGYRRLQLIRGTPSVLAIQLRS